MTMTAKLKLPYIAGSQDQAITNHGTMLFEIDALINCGVIDRTLSSPPAAVVGDVYIIGPSPTGDWDPAADDSTVGWIAVYDGAAWKLFEPMEGWTAWITLEKVRVVYDGTSWKSITGESVFGAYDNAGGQTINGTPLLILWDTESRKDTGSFDHDTVTNSNEIVLLEAGWYEVTYTVAAQVTATAGLNRITARALKNGSQINGTLCSSDITLTNGPERCNLNATFYVQAAASDILEIEVVRTSGSGTCSTIAQSSRVSVRRI